MSFDWFVDIDERVVQIIQNLDEIDRKLSKEKAERDEELQRSLGQKRKDIEKRLNNKIYAILNEFSYANTKISALSSIYLECKSLNLKDSETLRYHYIDIVYKNGKSLLKESLQKNNLHEIYNVIKTPSIDISKLPLFSFFLQFIFTLATPYLSKDDEEFYIHENPVRKDKVFKTPLISGSTWKGNLRWTAMKIFTDELPERTDESMLSKYFEKRSQIIRLFGYEKDAVEDYLNSVLAEKLNGGFIESKKSVEEKFKKFLEEKGYISPKIEGRRGRLNFFPTFFEEIGLNIINPHSRETKAGTTPIYLENVPTEADGTFSLLYIPFDLIGQPIGKVKKEVEEDLEFIEKVIKAMMLTYGFSAKKDSGFGIIERTLQGGSLRIKGIEPFKSFKDFCKLEKEILEVKAQIENYGG